MFFVIFYIHCSLGDFMFNLFTLFNNLRYLARYNVKDLYKRLNCVNSISETTIDDIYYALDHIKYEIEADLKLINKNKYKFCGTEETIEKLINSNCSICRFGDGEINLMRGNDIPCQHASKKLSMRLKEVLSSNNDSILVAIRDLYGSFGEGGHFFVRKFSRTFYARNHSFIANCLNHQQLYYTAGMTFPYINVGINSSYDFEHHYDRLKSIWKDKDIAIICGDRVFSCIEYNIFDCAKSIEYLYAPTNNAFDEYDSILNRAKSIDKNKIVFIVLGPTATVLAYDLALLGYRALDMGHIAKDYDAYRKKVPSTSENICEFFAPE